MADMIAMLHGLGQNASAAGVAPRTRDQMISAVRARADSRKITGAQFPLPIGDFVGLWAEADFAALSLEDKQAVDNEIAIYTKGWIERPLFGSARMPFSPYLFYTSPVVLGGAALVIGAAIYLWRRNR